jgi:release factor glutamine methyltransferase
METQLQKSYSSIEMIFISHILGKSKQELYLKGIKLNIEQINLLHKYNMQYQKGLPVDYILGGVTLMGNTFKLNTSVLIPRPETEELIHKIVNNQHKTNLLLDVGTGSGLIGISLNKTYETIIMTDISQKAVTIARKNIAFNAILNCKVVKCDLLEHSYIKKIIEKNTDWTLVANLPYVPEQDAVFAVQNSVQHEPKLALYSGKDGLDCFRRLIIQLQALPLPLYCYFELDPRNINKASTLIKQFGYSTSTEKDQNSHKRFLICTRI